MSLLIIILFLASNLLVESEDVSFGIEEKPLESHSVNVRHHHHSHPYGPHFEEEGKNVTVKEGAQTSFDCRVSFIEDKMVSWVRRRFDELELLTVGIQNHSADGRITSDFKYPNNWRLFIRNASRGDSGLYMCQISTHPPKVLEIKLVVEAPEVFIENSLGKRISEVHYQEGSTLSLVCSVRKVESREVSWYRNSDLLNQDVIRGGVSIRTEITSSSGRSVLKVARVSRKDSGTYSCTAPPHKATVSVHVLAGGEAPAELHHNDGFSTTHNEPTHRLISIILIIHLIIHIKLN